MREIKFRAWDIRNEVMWLRKPKQLTSEFFQLIEQDEQGGEQFALMQYTGLKDKNGVEIYEGDIMEGSAHTPRMRIFWNDVSAKFQGERLSKNHAGGQHSMGYLATHRRVIGNIYENPELLK